MSTAIAVSATRELEAIEPRLVELLPRLQEQLNALTPEELTTVLTAATTALEDQNVLPSSIVEDFPDTQTTSRSDRVRAEIAVLLRSFETRRALLEGALSTREVAVVLGVSRQTPHDRVAAGSLLAVKDGGTFRFPRWQFDPQGEDGVVRGLPVVVRAMSVSSLAKIAWFTRANNMLDGRTPLDRLKAGEVDRVVRLARAVGVS